MEALAPMGSVTEENDNGQQEEGFIGPMENPDPKPQSEENRAEKPENPEQHATDVRDLVEAANIVAGMEAMEQNDYHLEEAEVEYGEENKPSFIKSIWKKFAEFFKRFFQKKQ